MITKGIINSIDYLSNSCIVRLPIFETTSDNTVETTAYFSTSPGQYNAYKAGDIVIVGFLDNSIGKPIILGSFFINANTELSHGGVINADSLNIITQAKLPADVQFNVNNKTNTISKLLTLIDTQEARISELESKQTLYNTVLEFLDTTAQTTIKVYIPTHNYYYPDESTSNSYINKLYRDIARVKNLVFIDILVLKSSTSTIVRGTLNYDTDLKSPVVMYGSSKKYILTELQVKLVDCYERNI